MRKILWMIIFFGVYVWLMTSGRDQMVLEQGKNIYQAVIAWLDDAEIDFQTKDKNKAKKKSRRWD
jgi:dUTPase